MRACDDNDDWLGWRTDIRIRNRYIVQCHQHNNGNESSQVTYVTLVPRGNETLRRNARGTPSALSSSESYV